MTRATSSARRYAERGHNRLLDLLPDADRDRLLGLAEPASLNRGDVMAPPDRPLAQVIFPTTCIGSALTIMADGSAIETGTVGNEGFVGLQVLFDVEAVPGETVCQVGGDAIAVRTDRFRAFLDESEAMRRIGSRYAQAFLIMSSHSTACNRLHSVEQRYARWVLMTHDRSDRDTFDLTQEYLAMMLGVRRASVSVAASQFKTRGIIDYHRGGVVIHDRAGLEAAACECYAVTRDTYDLLLGRED